MSAWVGQETPLADCLAPIILTLLNPGEFPSRLYWLYRHERNKCKQFPDTNCLFCDLSKYTYSMFPDTNCLFVTFQILWPLNTMNCGVLRPQINSLWPFILQIQLKNIAQIWYYWLYLLERIHIQCFQTQIVSLWPFKYCDLWTQWTVVYSDHK